MNSEKLIEMYKATKNEMYANDLYNKNIKFLYKLANDFKCDFDICLIGFTKALNKFDSNKGKFTTLLYHTIRNEALMEARKKQVNCVSMEEMTNDNMTIGDSLESDFDLMGELESKDNLKNMLSILSTTEKAYLIDSAINGFTYKEIASKYGVKTQSVANTISKAINKIRGNYGKIFNK